MAMIHGFWQAIYFVWLMFFLMVLPASIPLVMPFVIAKKLLRVVPKWTFSLRYSVSNLLVISFLVMLGNIVEVILKAFGH